MLLFKITKHIIMELEISQKKIIYIATEQGRLFVNHWYWTTVKIVFEKLEPALKDYIFICRMAFDQTVCIILNTQVFYYHHR